MHVVVCTLRGGFSIHCHSADEEGVPERLCSRAFLFIVLRSAQHPQKPRFPRGIWPMPLPLSSYSALALFCATHTPTSARSIGFCVIWVCISSSSSSCSAVGAKKLLNPVPPRRGLRKKDDHHHERTTSECECSIQDGSVEPWNPVF